MSNLSGAEVVAWQLALTLLTALGLGWAARRCDQPALLGQMLAGVLLGPSCLGALWPEMHRSVFGSGQAPLLRLLGTAGLVLLMFITGLEFRLNHSSTSVWNGRLAAAVQLAAVAFAAPFALGAALAWALLRWAPGLHFGAVSPVIAVCFLGLALAVTALPILARLLQETRLSRTWLGELTLLAASISDAFAWLVLALILGSVQWPKNASAAWTLVCLLGSVTLLLSAGALLRRIRVLSVAARLPAVLSLLLLSTALSECAGLHPALTAFGLGLLAAHAGVRRRDLAPLEPLTLYVLVPLYLTSAGFAVEFSDLGRAQPWSMALLLIVVGSASKIGSGFWAGRRLGARPPQALAIGLLMNTRGLFELVLLRSGLDHGVITAGFYSVLVIMTFVTTALTTPLLGALRRHHPELEGPPVN